MMGGITAGFCLREWELWYGDKPADGPCPIPLSDGDPCGDIAIKGADCRCPYNKESGLSVDMTGQRHTTYAYLNKDPK
jgi:hypothetical protein